MRATVRASPFGSARSFKAAMVCAWQTMRPAAIALRSCSGFRPTSTIRGSPPGSRWENSLIFHETAKKQGFDQSVRDAGGGNAKQSISRCKPGQIRGILPWNGLGHELPPPSPNLGRPPCFPRIGLRSLAFDANAKSSVAEGGPSSRQSHAGQKGENTQNATADCPGSPKAAQAPRVAKIRGFPGRLLTFEQWTAKPKRLRISVVPS